MTLVRLPPTIRRPAMPPMPVSIRPYRSLPLGYFSVFESLIPLLFLRSGPAYAEWVSVAKSNQAGSTVYVAPGTIRRKGDLVKMWHLFDNKTAETYRDNSVLSIKGQNQYDCADERTRVLAYTFFSGNMGSGTVVYSNPDEGKWQPVAPDSTAKELWKIGCDKN